MSAAVLQYPIGLQTVITVQVYSEFRACNLIVCTSARVEGGAETTLHHTALHHLAHHLAHVIHQTIKLYLAVHIT